MRNDTDPGDAETIFFFIVIDFLHTKLQLLPRKNEHLEPNVDPMSCKNVQKQPCCSSRPIWRVKECDELDKKRKPNTRQIQRGNSAAERLQDPQYSYEPHANAFTCDASWLEAVVCRCPGREACHDP